MSTRDYITNYQQPVQFDAQGRPFRISNSGQPFYLSPNEAAQEAHVFVTDPAQRAAVNASLPPDSLKRLTAYAAAHGVTPTNLFGDRPDNTFAHTYSMDPHTGAWKSGMNWGGLGGLILGASAVAAPLTLGALVGTGAAAASGGSAAAVDTAPAWGAGGAANASAFGATAAGGGTGAAHVGFFSSLGHFLGSEGGQAAINAGSAIYGGHQQIAAGDRAAQIQQKAAAEALQFQREQAAEDRRRYDEQQGQLKAQWDAEQARLAPYRQASASVLARAMGMAPQRSGPRPMPAGYTGGSTGAPLTIGSLNRPVSQTAAMLTPGLSAPAPLTLAQIANLGR